MHRAAVIRQCDLPTMPAIVETSEKETKDSCGTGVEAEERRSSTQKLGCDVAEGGDRPVGGRKRTRGGRRRRKKEQEVWTFNNSGGPQLKAALD